MERICENCRWFRRGSTEKGTCVAWGPEVICIQGGGERIPGLASNIRIKPTMDTLTVWPIVVNEHDCIKFEGEYEEETKEH